MLKQCKECGKEFETFHGRKIYCGSECRQSAFSKEAKRKYDLNPEARREDAKRWAREHPEHRRATNLAYKERTRHGGIKEKLIVSTGRFCSKCGKEGDSFEIVGHHITGNPNEHDKQELLCRSCHFTLHLLLKPKMVLDRESIKEAIASTTSVDDAAAMLGVSRSKLYKERKRLGMFDQPCPTCGKVFEKNRDNLVYCSECTEKLKPFGYVKFYVDKLKQQYSPVGD